MDRRRGYIATGAVLLLIAACVAAALLAPKVIGGWYEGQSLGQVTYEKISYEPYKIRYYDSFEEKLDAIAACTAYGYEVHTLQINERTQNVKDEELIDIVNEELSDMYEAGLIPEKTKALSINSRTFNEAYTFISTMDGEREQKKDALRNVYFWMLDCDTEYGSVTVKLDSEYHKFYTLVIYEEPLSGSTDEWAVWQEHYVAADEQTIVQGWLDYWEIQGLAENAAYEESVSKGVVDAMSSEGLWIGDGRLWFSIRLSSGNYLDMMVHLFGDHWKVWGIHTGLEFF